MQSSSIHCCLWTGQCVTVAAVENVNRSQCLNTERGLWGLPNCITAHSSGWCFSLYFGGDGTLACCSRVSVCWRRSRKQRMAFKSQFLKCHIANIEVRTRADRTTRLDSSYCIMLFFVKVYNAQYHVPQHVGGNSSHPECVLKVCLWHYNCVFKGRLETNLVTLFWRWSWVRLNVRFRQYQIDFVCILTLVDSANMRVTF